VARGGDRGFGLTGSSMVVVNPPHGLAETLREVLPFLAQALAQFEGATHKLELHDKWALRTRRRT
jgi:23S rRNA (adenine2030-N6)-methyltransferase